MRTWTTANAPTLALAAALAGAEDDPVALKLAIATYEELLARATRNEERVAVSRALEALRGR